MTRQTHILIIEDDADARNVMRLALANDQREIREASNAEETFTQLESYIPDILLLDIRLKDSMDGLTLYEKIATDIRFANSKVIIVSGVRAHEEIEKARKLGAAVFLKKPFSPDKLNALVSSLESKEMFIVPPVSADKEKFSYDELLDW